MKQKAFRLPCGLGISYEPAHLRRIHAVCYSSSASGTVPLSFYRSVDLDGQCKASVLWSVHAEPLQGLREAETVPDLFFDR